MNLKELKEKVAWKGLKSIEFRILSMSLRVLAGAACFAYIMSSASGAWTWVQVQRVRLQDISAFESVVKAGDAAFTEKWISYRPLSESAELLDRVAPLSPGLSSMAFFNLARRAEWLGDAEGALTWRMIGRFRLRYDMLRCGVADADAAVDFLLRLFAVFDARFAEGLSHEDSVRLARKALAFDTKYPAANDPKRLCWMLNKVRRTNYEPVAPEQWESIRFTLRHLSDLSLSHEETKGPPASGAVK